MGKRKYEFYKVDGAGNPSVCVGSILIDDDMPDLELRKLIRRVFKLGRLSLDRLYLYYDCNPPLYETDKIVIWKYFWRGYHCMMEKIGVGLLTK